MQKGKGTLRPKTLLNFLVAVYEKPENSCHFDSKNRRSLHVTKIPIIHVFVIVFVSLHVGI